MAEKIGMGVIGAGIMGDSHSRVYAELEGTELVGVADIVESKAKEVAEKYGAKESYSDYEELLRNPDIQAVSIATPDFFHYEPIMASVQAGKHVLVEKPMTTDMEEADKILSAVRESDVKFMVNYSHRWVPAYFQAKAAIEEGQIGQPIMGYARKNDRIYVSTEMLSWAGKSSSAMFLSAHDVDLMRWYVSSEGEEVYANAVSIVLKKRGIDAPDCIQAQVKFKSGAIITFESCWIYPNTFPTLVDSFMEIIGTDGVIHLDREKEQIQLATHESFQYPRNLLTYPIFGTLRGAFQLSLSHFVDCILEDKDPEVSGEDGRNVTAILCAIHESIDKGEPVKVSI